MMKRIASLGFLAVTGIVLVAGAGCKKKPADKKQDTGSMTADMGTVEMAPAMGSMDRAAMRPRRAEARPRPVKLSFQEQVKRSIPVTPKPASQTSGKLSLSAELCRVTGATFLAPSNMNVLKGIAVHGDVVYVLNHKGEVLRFRATKGKGCALTLDKKWGAEGVLKVPHRVGSIATDQKGNLVVASFMGVSRFDKEGKALPKCKPGKNGNVALHPSGKWGLVHFVNSTVFLATFTPKTCSGKPWVLQDLNKPKAAKGDFQMVNTIGFYKNLVLVGGLHKDKVKGSNPRVVIAYTKDGKKKFQFGRLEGFGDDRFGWVHAIAEGKKAPIWVLDSNFRRLSAWDAKGKFVGAVQLAKLFGVHYPWIASFATGPKGTGWFVVGVSRKFKEKAPKGTRWNVGEGFIFRVTGL